MSNEFKDRRYEKAHSILTDLVTAISMNMEFLERKGCDIEKEINFNNYVKRQICMAKCWLREYEEAMITGGNVEL